MKKNNKKGFTLVELVIVVAVMAILVAVAIPTVGAITTKARNATNESNAQTIESMIKLAEADGATSVESYLESAALGIKEGTYQYNNATGECTTTEVTSNGLKIEFGSFTSGSGNTTTTKTVKVTTIS